MNDLVRNTGAANAVAALGGLRSTLRNVKKTMVVKGGDPYLRMQKDGVWVYGQEDVEVGKGSLWAINPMSLMHGFIAWPDGEEGGKPLGEVMVPGSEELPLRHTLPEVDGDWDQQFSLILKCVKGEDAGTQVLYKTASTGGTNAVNKLIGLIDARIDDDPEHPVPIVELLSDSYPHKKYGKIRYPVFDVRDWANMAMDDYADNTGEVERAAEPAPAPEPAKRTRRTKAQMEAAKAPIAQRVADDTAHAERMARADMTQAVPSLEELEAMLAARKAQAAPQEDPAAARRRELEAELAALAVGGGTPRINQPGVAEAGDPGQPIRRRRQ
jgi:hypothetical protein